MILSRVAERHAKIIGADADALVRVAIEDAIAAVKDQKEHLVSSAVLRSARDRVLKNMPNRDKIKSGGLVKVEIDVSVLRSGEEARFDKWVDAQDWDGLLTRYPLRESSAFDRVVSGIKISDQSTYRAAVLKLLQDEPATLSDLRNLLGDLYANVAA